MEEKQAEINFRPKRQQFKLCFAPKCAVGRSYVQVNRPLHTVIPVAPKSNNTKLKKPENLHKYIDKLTVQSPKQKYTEPITENQVYGWYNAEFKKRDPLLYHGRKLDSMLQENLMNFAKIRIT